MKIDATGLNFPRYFAQNDHADWVVFKKRNSTLRSEAGGLKRVKREEEREARSTEYKPSVLISFSRTGFFKREMAVLSK